MLRAIYWNNQALEYLGNLLTIYNRTWINQAPECLGYILTDCWWQAPHLSFHTLHPQIVDTKIDESQRNRPADLDLSETDFLDLGGRGTPHVVLT
jgi:hypothetical protein